MITQERAYASPIFGMRQPVNHTGLIGPVSVSASQCDTHK